jgi:hypothetical protein
MAMAPDPDSLRRIPTLDHGDGGVFSHRDVNREKYFPAE